MSLSTKILIWLAAIFLITALGFIIYFQIDNSNRQSMIESSLVAQKQLVDGMIRSQSQLTTKADLDKYIKENGINLAAIKSDLSKLHAEVNSINIIVTSSKGQHSSNIPTTTGSGNPIPVDPKNPDPHGYMKAQQVLTLNEDFGTIKLPIGKVSFSAWQEKPWGLDIKARDYQLYTVVGLDENQRSYFYNKFSVKIDNKDYELPIKSAITKQELPDAKFSFWNPRLFLTTGGAVSLTQIPVQASANAGATLGIMSYGKFKNTPAISILQVGVAYQTNNQKPSVIINPINFNVGPLLPDGLVNNTYIGPSMQIDTSGNVLIGANVSIGF